MPIWQSVARAQNEPGQTISWYLGGTLPDWIGTPVTLALLLEEDEPAQAIEAGQKLLSKVFQP